MRSCFAPPTPPPWGPLALGLASLLLGFGCAEGPAGDEEARAPAVDVGPASHGDDAAAPQPQERRERPPEAEDLPAAACDPGAPLPEAYEPGGPQEEGATILPGGRRVSPAGTLAPLGRAPIGLALSPDGSRAYVTCDGDEAHALQVVDTAEGTVLQTLRGFTAFRGVAVSPDGARVLVAAGASGRLLRFDLDEAGQLQPSGELALSGYLGDLVITPDGGRAYVASNTASRIFEVEIESMTLGASMSTGNFPYDLLLDPEGSRLFVSNLASSTLQVFELEGHSLVAEIPTPMGPQGMAWAAALQRLYVACADDDTVLVLDGESLLPLDELDLSHHPEGLLAATPNDLAVSVAGDQLFVVQADLNQVDVLDAEHGALLGSLPAGWYPVAVEALPDGERLAVLATKGLGGGNRQLDPTGLLQLVALPEDEAALQAASDLAWANNTRPSRFYARDCPQPVVAADGKLPIEHVVLLVRENKTYDMVLGDLEGANGDPALVLFGEEITPNLHALAREFVNMDNFFSDPEESLQGHLWTTRADCSDFVEKLRHTQLPLAGYEPASLGASPSIFDHCLRHGVSFRNYGEVASFGPELLGRMRDFIDPKYPFFNMGVRDEAKAAEVIREWSLGIFPQFIYIGLPNDHTYGTRPGAPTPESMVSDNDRATGMLVDWISHGPYWESTVIFIIEDDPQSWRGDHVDAHRSISVVVSPWVKRNYLSSVHYSIPSIYRTLELLLGLPPMNKNDAGAAPMYDIFRRPEDGPDLRPFDALPLGVPHALNAPDAILARESAALPWDGVDGVPGLGEILWRARKGAQDPPPYAKGIDR